MGLKTNTFGFGDIPSGGGGGGGVNSVTGLNTNNADPANPVVQISVDGTTITGSGTPLDPLVANVPTVNAVGISDDSGVYTYYADFTSAMAAATSGQTITFFAHVIESGSGVGLKDRVNINLNGYSYTNDSTTLSDVAVFVASTSSIISIYNGKILRLNATTPTDRSENVCFRQSVAGSTIYFENVTIESFNGIALNSDGGTAEIYGGKFIGNYVVEEINSLIATNANLYGCEFIKNYSVVNEGSQSIFENCLIQNNVVSQGGFFHNCTIGQVGGLGISNIVNTCVISNCTINGEVGGSFFRILGSSMQSTMILADTNIVQNCSIRANVGIFFQSGSLNLLTGCTIEAFNGSCIEIGNFAGDGIEISNCSLINLSSGFPIISIDNVFTGTGLKIVDNYADADDATTYFVSCGVVKNAYVASNVVNGVLGLLNNINNLQVNTTDSFGNLIIN